MSGFFRPFIRSLRHAVRGILLAYRTERSFRVQSFVAACVILLMVLLPLAAWERVVLVLAMGSVLVLELLNSSVERLADLLKPRLHEYVADMKDLLAGAVLIASACSALLGLLILWPHVATMFARL